MIAGLPLGTWILIALSTLLGLILVVTHYIIHSRAGGRDSGQRRGPRDDG